jgi:signal transduction histidine kinase/ActR/RegA family two-component response regulator
MHAPGTGPPWLAERALKLRPYPRQLPRQSVAWLAALLALALSATLWRGAQRAHQDRTAPAGTWISQALADWRTTGWGDLLLPLILLCALVASILLLRAQMKRREIAEAALRKSEERHRRLMELSSDWYWEMDQDLRFTWISQGKRDAVARPTLSTSIGKRPWEVVSADMTREQWAAHRAQLESHLAFREVEISRPGVDGQPTYSLVNGEPVLGPDGEFLGYLGVGWDITERRRALETRNRLETQIQQMLKMDALGTLAGGVAHDFNNILAVIIGNVAVARADAGPDQPVQTSLAEIQKAALHGRDLVGQILTFSRLRGNVKLQAIALDSVVNESLSMLRATLAANVELTCNFGAGSHFVRGDKTRLAQLLMNLCSNAWHALQGKPGRISITVDAVGEAELAGLVDLPAASGYVLLSVADSGAGMDEATRKRIFDPFFTTKPAGQGTGLGLAVVHGIVKSHDGHIFVDSQPGQGSRFRLYLPAAQSHGEPLRPARSAPALTPALPQGQGQRIMYLDDEPALVSLASRQLRQLGYKVVGHTRDGDALSAFEANPAGFDALVTDSNMPGRMGLDVAARMLRIRPDFPIALSSGYVSDGLRAQAWALGVREIIDKPATVEELAHALQRLVAQVQRVTS